MCFSIVFKGGKSLGNKLIELVKIVRRFYKFEKKIASSMIAMGLLIIGQSFSVNFWENILFDLYNTLFNRNIPITNDSVKYGYIIVSTIVGGALMFWGFRFYYTTREKEKTNSMVVIQHSSIESVSYMKIEEDLSDYRIDPYTLNQTDELKVMDNANLIHALKEQEKLVDRISKRIDGSADIEVAYMGLAHIPLVMLLGYQLSDKISPVFYEWNENKWNWEQIKSKPTHEIDTLHLIERNTSQNNETAKEVVVKIGLTYPIGEADIQELQLENLDSYYLYLDPNKRNAIKSLEQLQSYKITFRTLLDQINQRYPYLETVHLFYSGQPSLAYILGSSISSRMDVDILIYNHIRMEKPKYKWAIKLPRKDSPYELKINEKRD